MISNGLTSKSNDFIAEKGQYILNVGVSGIPLKAGVFSLGIPGIGCSVIINVKDSLF